MKKKNKKGIIGGIVIVIVVLIIAYFGYKTYLINYYSDKSLNYSFKEISNAYKIKDNITIKTQKLNEKDYIQLKELKLKNDFKNFTKSDVDDTSVIYTNKSNKSQITISINPTYLDFYYLVESDLEGVDNKNTTYQDRIDYLKKNNVTNDIELFKFLASDNYKKNVFASIKDIKGTYATYLVAQIMVPQEITKINGDLKGYIRIKDNVKEVNILKNNKRYMLMLVGDYFTEDKVTDLLNTIVIEDK